MTFATLHDVARSAGVSYATVDRVVNDRGGVALKSVVRVQDAIDQLGYERDMSAANLARKRVYHFHFLLPDDSNDFFRVLNDALIASKEQPNLFRIALEITRIPAFSEEALIAALNKIDLSTADCVCVVALDTPAVIEAIARARASGLKIVTLVSDIKAAARDCYVGIDNVVAGKTAGRMMGLAHGRQAGVVLPIIGANRAQDHTHRLDGFRDVLRTHFPKVVLLDPVKSRDDAQTVGEALTSAWKDRPDLTGVYNIGAGNAGLIDWVRGISPDHRPAVVIHELLPVSRAALKDGLIDAVIDQKPYETISQALRIMRLLVDDQPVPQLAPVITPAIYLSENLPPLTPLQDRKPNE